MFSRFVRQSLLILFLLSVSSTYLAAFQVDPRFPLTLGLPGDAPSKTKVIYNSRRDEYFAVYQYDNTILNWPSQIHAARIRPDGTTLASYFISDLPYDCVEPDVAYDPILDRYLVVWTYDTSGSDALAAWDIYGRFIPWSGPVSTLTSFEIEDDPYPYSLAAGLAIGSDLSHARVAYSESNRDFQVVMVADTVGVDKNIIAGVRVANHGYTIWKNLALKPGTALFDREYNSPDLAYNSYRDEFFIVFDDTDSVMGLTVPGQQNEGTYEQDPTRIETVGLFPNGGGALAGEYKEPAIAYLKKARTYVITWLFNIFPWEWEVLARYYPGDREPPVSQVYSEYITPDGAQPIAADVACQEDAGECFITMVVISNSTYFTYGRQKYLNNDGFLTHSTGYNAPLDNLSTEVLWGASTPDIGIGGGSSSYCMGFSGLGPTSIPHAYVRLSRPTKNYGWLQVAAGGHSSYGLHSNGSLWSWGKNTYGQLGLGDGLNRDRPKRIGVEDDWVKVSSTHHHTLGIKRDGSLWAWGRNFDGQLGNGTVVLGHQESVHSPDPEKIDDGSAWSDISAGYDHSLGIKSDGSLWAWGRNDLGQLGLFNSINLKAVPTALSVGPDFVEGAWRWHAVSAGLSHSLAIRGDGTLWAWGDNRSGQLGLGSSIGSSTYARKVGDYSDWVAIDAGEDHSLGVRADGTLWAWGGNAGNSLGLPLVTKVYYKPTQVGTASSWVSVAGGTHFSLGIRTTLVSFLYSFGTNASGQLGLGNLENQQEPKTVPYSVEWMTMAAGFRHSLAIRKDGSLWATGTNSYGQLGLGGTGEKNKFTKVDSPLETTSWNLFLPAIMSIPKP